MKTLQSIPVEGIPAAPVAATRCQFWGVGVEEGLCPGGVSIQAGDPLLVWTEWLTHAPKNTCGR